MSDGSTDPSGSLFSLIHSSSFSDSLVFLMTSLTQKSTGCGYNEHIVQDNLHVKPDLPVTACQATLKAYRSSFSADVLW